MKRNKNIAIYFNRIVIFTVGFLFLILNSIIVNAQTIDRPLQFGNFSNSGPGHITVSSDAFSTVTTDGQVQKQAGGSPQSAILHVVFEWKSPYQSVSISYSNNIQLTDGANNSILLVPDPVQTFQKKSPGNQAYDLYVYIGGTLTLGSTIMPAGTYTCQFTVYCGFNTNF